MDGPTIIVKVYNSVGEYNNDVQRMLADGWTVNYRPIRPDSKAQIGRRAAKAVLIGGVALAMTGPSKKSREITVTYARQDYRSAPVREQDYRPRGPRDLAKLGEPRGGAVRQPEQRVLRKEGNRWVRALYAISDAVFLISVVGVGVLMITQAPWFGVPLIASGIVLVYRVAHGVKSPWL